ncbi:hypothetical protein [Ramlibacter humi]|uniref:Uncharacterized protein n=1 Tax=Ramlibacter humi TaxID=2530451 RepID=A0A4Z0CC30_9BURK|nr:hypothetical protein [Ramlibacter humi]TFZ08931.1 hypothetical protein EZ216_07255 [Ramlibacter humi]
MTEPDNELITIDTSELERLVGEDVVVAILSSAPLKVQTRVAKAAHHLQKAIRLEGFDEEMGVIRLIAAEEELVVAIFELLKLNADHFPEHRDFVSKKKNHLVKLAFTPVLSEMATVFEDFLKNGLAPAGLEGVTTWRVVPAVKDGKAVLTLFAHDGKFLIDVNPLDVSISRDEASDDEVVQHLYDDFFARLPDDGENRVKTFITQRADYRNKLLYAEDGQSYLMGETLAEIRAIVERDLTRLLWCLAALLTNKPASKRWGAVGQFIALYRRVLLEAKVLRPAEFEAYGLLPAREE